MSKKEKSIEWRKLYISETDARLYGEIIVSKKKFGEIEKLFERLEFTTVLNLKHGSIEQLGITITSGGGRVFVLTPEYVICRDKNIFRVRKDPSGSIEHFIIKETIRSNEGKITGIDNIDGLLRRKHDETT